MNLMVQKLSTLKPEMVMAAGSAVCLLAGLAPARAVRRAVPWVAGVTLLAAAGHATMEILDPTLASPDGGWSSGLTVATYVKLAVAAMGLLLLLAAGDLPAQLKQAGDIEAGAKPFDATLVLRGEFFAFFLLSLTGVMLCAAADDLVWLFLALELVSLPTYVMVAVSRDKVGAQEAAVKYFFLGALAAAVFLYGFTLIYGATGQTQLGAIRDFALTELTKGRALPPMLVLGVVLAVIGLCFKIAAVPMHFYAADVYQGAAAPVTAFLAFVPKTAGFVSIILMLWVLGWPDHPLPQPVWVLLWVLAALTMTVGNVLGLLQTNVKRVLAYSSIAHSGYMLVGLIGASTGPAGSDTPRFALGNGIGAVLFYLVAYGLATTAAFAALACLRSRGEEAETFDDISGLWRRSPALAAILLVSTLSLIGVPPLVGFLGKVYLFGAAVQQGTLGLVLVIIAVLNSAVSAVYYLRIVGACYFGPPGPDANGPQDSIVVPARARRVGAALAAIAAVALGFGGAWLIDAANRAELRRPAVQVVQQPAPPAAAAPVASR